MPDTGEATLPTAGPLTFLFTDIEGSTRKAHELGDDWFAVLEAHHALLRPVFAAHGGAEVSTAGDSFFVVFEDAARAVAATIAMQHAIGGHDWSPLSHAIKVRMGLHTGLARFRAHDNDYAGLTVHAASRVESAAAGAQVLITQATLDAAQAEWPDEVDTIDLGFHRLKDLPAELRLYQLAANGLEREFPPVRGLDVVRNNVPVPPSSFVGRTEVLARLHRLLDDDRLVTVVGPGGTGKTRVALRVATERLARHPDGVWFVELAGTVDAAGVVAAFANALGVHEDPQRGLLDSIADDVRDKNVLLVVDNCEHVIDEAAVVIERLLASGLGVCALATSREPLELEAERLLPLAPLGTDDGGEAVTLLGERIALVQPDFALDAGTLPDALTIARRLDGLPLALELAAASAASLPLDEIARQLDDRFDLLTHGKRTAAERQKTLRGAIEWSYGLLRDDEQTLFRRLAVFPAEFDFGVAHAVCGADLADDDETLAALIRKSLVAESPTTRLRYLESIRAFAHDELDACGERAAIEERHAHYFVDEIDDEEMERSEWVDTISDDLAAAMRWGADHDRGLQLRAVIWLQPFWARKGRWSEGRATSDAVLATTIDLEESERRRVLSETGRLALHLGQRDAAREYFTQAADLAERVDTPDDANVVLGDLAQFAMWDGDFNTAEVLLTRALDAARRSEKEKAVVLCLAHLATVVYQREDLPRAWDLASEGVARARELEWTDLDFNLTNLLGMIARRRGDLPEARRALSDAVDIARKGGNEESTAYVLFCLAAVEADDNQPAAARPYLRDAITLAVATGGQGDLADSLELSARLLGDAALLATADAIRDRIGYPRDPADLAAYEALKEQLSDADALDTDAAVQRALELLAD